MVVVSGPCAHNFTHRPGFSAHTPSFSTHVELQLQVPLRYDLIPCTMFSLLPRKDDVDAGFVFSGAEVNARTLSSNYMPIRAKANESTALPRNPEIFLEKSLRAITVAAGIDPTYSDAGDTATFDIYITNTGNTRLNEVVLTDGMFNDGITCDYRFNGTTSGFLPLHPDGHRIACEAVTHLTSADVDTGYIASTAEVSMSTTDSAYGTCSFLYAVLLEHVDQINDGRGPPLEIQVAVDLQQNVCRCVRYDIAMSEPSIRHALFPSVAPFDRRVSLCTGNIPKSARHSDQGRGSLLSRAETTGVGSLW